MGKFRKWTPEELELLRTLYPTTDTYELAQMTGRSRGVITHKASKLGIRKTHEFKSELTRKTLQKEDIQRRAHEGWRKTWKADHRRWKNDLPQRTRLHFSAQTKAKVCYRQFLRLRGYIEFKDQKNIVYYTGETHRIQEWREQRAYKRYHLKFLPYELND